MPKTTLSIIIPVRNEQINLKIMLKILTCILEVPYEIMVVYDSQNDNSIPIIKTLQTKFSQINSIYNLLGKGVANAIKSGVKKSNGKYILIFAADEVGPVLAIEDMLVLMEKGCDLVSCTRYAYGGRRLGGSRIQAFLSKLGNNLFNAIVGTTLTDSTTGIKMFRRDIFEKINLESNVGWAVLFELTIKAQMHGMKLGEVPITSIDRLYGGRSTFSMRIWFVEYMKWFLYGIFNLRLSNKKSKIQVRIPQNTTQH